MCGIAGSTSTDQAGLQALTDALAHRGPDDHGVWSDGAIGLAHTRLSIIDLSATGHQPMVSPCGRWALTFNGEIYNYQALRTELSGEGIRFSSSSDTEVLLALLSRRGVEGLTQVVGMFAFALWDRQRQELLLGRDRLGIKPLVFAPLPDGGIAFASEIQALRRLDLARTDAVDREAISQYLACLYIPAPRTAWQGISKLRPGHILRWRAGSITIEPWWQPRFVSTRTVSHDTAVAELSDLLRSAVRDHMVSDVLVGCFLSGGIDSSVIAALMAEARQKLGAPPLQTFTMTFDEAAYDERQLAAAVAQHIRSEHTELPSRALGAIDRLNQLTRFFGEPFGNPTSLLIDELSHLAREHVKVALVGDGGDEVFAGYPRYRGGLLAQTYRHIPSSLRTAVEYAAALLPDGPSGRHGLRRVREFLTEAGKSDPEMYAGWVEYFSPQERAELLDLPSLPPRPIAQVYQAVTTGDSLDTMQHTDLLTFLPGNLLAYGDAMSMRHALELRLPLLDHRIVEYVSSLPANVRYAYGAKSLLRAIAARLLPASIVHAPKRGFNPPIGRWINQDLAQQVADRLTPSRLGPLGIQWRPVARLLDEHRQGYRDHGLKIWALLALEAWASG